jgi:hypothetical protein
MNETVTEERELLDFLLARLRCDQAHDHRWVGTSSTALVIAAIDGEEPTARPHDGWDLGRCYVTRAVAPECLHERMDAILARWTAAIEDAAPYYGLSAAREMAARETPAVRALVEDLKGAPSSAS